VKKKTKEKTIYCKKIKGEKKDFFKIRKKAKLLLSRYCICIVYVVPVLSS